MLVEVVSTTMSAVDTSGYCYLRIFSSINEATGEMTYDLTRVKQRFGRYPYVRRVFGYLYATAPWDCYIPSLFWVHAGLYHVSARGEPMLLIDAMVSVMFSGARIGGLGNNDDQAIRVNQGVATFAYLCETGGLNLETALAVSNEQINFVYTCLYIN